MDMLFKRYACPFLLLDEYISNGTMLEFVNEFLRIKAEEDDEETMWQYFLHKVFDKSYSDFKQSIKTSNSANEIDFETTISDSINILKGFNPD